MTFHTLMILMAHLGGGLFLIGLGAIVYMNGYRHGVNDTEQRWSEAVARKEAHDKYAQSYR